MSTIHQNIRRKAELFGAICGGTGAVIAVQSETASLALSTISASFFAGALGNLFAGAGEDPGVRPRAGIRSGVIAALVAGATAVTCFTFKAGGFAMLKIIPALLAIPPGAFFGLLGSLIVSMIQNPQVGLIAQKEPKAKVRPTALLVIILILSLAGYASPFIALMMPPQKAEVAVIPPVPVPSTPRPTPEPRPVIVRPPPWKYQTPADFASVRPSQLKVQREVSLGHFDSPLRFIHTDGGKRFAFVRSDTEIVSLDLNEPETTTSFQVPNTPQRFALSPDGKQMFCITQRPGIYVLQTTGAVWLPLPTVIPTGSISWLDEKHVSIGSQLLDLDSLQLTPAKPGPAVVESAHKNIRVRQSRRFQSVEEGTLNGRQQFVFSDSKRDYTVAAHFDGESPFLFPDGTKLLFTRRDELFVQYFDTQPSRETKLVAEMPGNPTAELAEALSSRRLCAVLCQPIINPLNNKPVGADVSRVKALLGVDSWVGKLAVFWVRDDYGMSVQNGDAVAFLAKNENGMISPLPEFSNWWALARDVNPTDAPERVAPVVPKEPPKQEPAQLSTKQETPSTLTIAQTTFLRAFIHGHHAKSSRNDVNGLIADYADRVDHFEKGVVTRDVVRAEEVEYHAPGVKVSEVLTEEPKLSDLGNKRYAAKYTIRFDRSNAANGKWARGFADVELTIELINDEPRIVRQNAKTRITEKGP